MLINQSTIDPRVLSAYLVLLSRDEQHGSAQGKGAVIQKVQILLLHGATEVLLPVGPVTLRDETN